MDRYDARPHGREAGAGFLVLAGSSGRLERERAEVLAAAGLHARAIRWFGGRGQRPAPHEVPLELFVEEIEDLRRLSDRVAVLGTSFGAEAALLTATKTAVDLVVAFAPTSVVWPGWHEGSWSSHWTWRGQPLQWVPFAADWTATTDPPEYRALYEQSMTRHPEEVERAVIPVERIAAPVILAAGGDDRVWPSVEFANRIVERRDAAGLPTIMLQHPEAGHRVILPGETVAQGGLRMARGGTEATDRALGRATWDAIRSALSTG